MSLHPYILLGLNQSFIDLHLELSFIKASRFIQERQIRGFLKRFIRKRNIIVNSRWMVDFLPGKQVLKISMLKKHYKAWRSNLEEYKKERENMTIKIFRPVRVERWSTFNKDPVNQILKKKFPTTSCPAVNKKKMEELKHCKTTLDLLKNVESRKFISFLNQLYQALGLEIMQLPRHQQEKSNVALNPLDDSLSGESRRANIVNCLCKNNLLDFILLENEYFMAWKFGTDFPDILKQVEDVMKNLKHWTRVVLKEEKTNMLIHYYFLQQQLKIS